MARKFTLAAGGALLLIAAAAGFIFLRSHAPQPQPQPQPLPAASQGQAPAAGKDLAASEEVAPERASGREMPVGAERAPVPHTLTVLDPQGQPIPGARVAWTELRGQLFEGYVSQDSLDWEAVEAATRRGASDQQGRVALDLDAAFGARSVIWVTHPRYSCDALLLSPGAGLPGVVKMREAAGIRVRVTRQDGGSAVGAIVTQVQAAGMLEEGSHLLDAVRVFRAEYVVGVDSTVLVDPHHREQGLRASHEGMQSERWWGPSPASIELVLGPTFTVLGEVHAEPEIDLSKAVVSASGVAGDALIGYGRHRVSASGTWGPMSIPSTTSAQVLVIRAEAPGAIPSEVSHDWPAANARLVVDHQLERGIPITAFVTDTAGVPLSSATTVLSWMKDDRWVQTHKVSGETGIVDLGMCPPGTFYLQAFHDEYGSTERGPLTIAVPSTEPFLLEIARPGLIEGRVVHAGNPVEDFTVCYQTSSTQPLRHRRFEGRSDGRFELDDAPRGELWIFAFADELPQSESIKVDLGDEPAEVELDLPAPLYGRGSVVDEVTREPLAAAFVDTRVMSFNTAWLSRGARLEVDADGSFHGDAFSPGSNTIMVVAPGYAQMLVTALSAGDDMVDFGVIALAHRQPLTVRVEGAMGRKCLVSISGADARGGEPVPESGVVLFEEMSPGTATVQVVVGAERTSYRQVRLVPGQDWIVDFDLSTTPNLTVEVVPPPGQDLPTGTTLGLVHGQGGAYANDVFYLPENGIAKVWRPEGTHVVVQLGNAEAELVGYAEVAPTQDHVLIRLDPRAARFLVRHEGQPLSGAVVSLALEKGEASWQQTTDVAGQADFSGFTAGDLFVSVKHAQHGFLPAVRVDFDDALGEGMELELDVTAVVEARLVDQGTPLPGVRAGIYAQPIDERLGEPSSDEGGIVTLGPIADGSYRVAVNEPSVWPVEQIVEARADGASPTVIEVRRRADLRVALSGPGRGGRRVRLQSLSVDGDPEVWLREGLIVASPAGMVTDGEGVLRVGGLPHGEYRWMVELASGDALTGEVTLPPAGVEELRVVVP